MKRETVNRIRYLLEECLPPVLRDSAPVRFLFRRYWGPLIDDLERFRARIHAVTPAEYADVYRRMPRIQDDTDNSAACVEAICQLLAPGSVCDVGCGTGFLLRRLAAAVPEGSALAGVDFQLEAGIGARLPQARFVESGIESLPFPDAAFDNVVCTHVLEHVLDLRGAISELRRITRRRLIVVVPLEREYRFTFNPHVHFFPYPHSFLRQAIPVPPTARHRVLGRDLLYWEDVGSGATDVQAQQRT